MEQTLGKRIVENRKRLGMTQDQLAEKLGLTAQAVSKWENDQSCPDITMLPKLAEIFGITTDELLGMAGPKKVHEAEMVENENDEGTLHIGVGPSENGKWEFHWDSGRKNGLTFAVCVLWVGIAYLLAKWFDRDVSFWGILWPSMLLIYGLAGIFPKFSVFNLGISLFGGYSLIHNLGIWQFDFAEELIFPSCIVLFGVGLLVDALRKPKKPRFTVTHNGKNISGCKQSSSECHINGERFECDLSFGSNTFPVELNRLAGGEASVSFGELVVDLTGCETLGEDCHIEANCSFGTLSIRVPQRFAVVGHNSTAFAAVNIIGQPQADPTGTIQLEANASFGEISIQYV